MATNLFLCEKDVHFSGVFTQFWDNFHLSVDGRFILEEIGEMLIGKTYVNESFTLMGGFKYKGKEGGEMFHWKNIR